MGRHNRKIITEYLVLYKPSHQKPVNGAVPLSTGLENLLLCPTGSGLRFITADCIGEMLFSSSPLELNSEIAAPSSETPQEGPSRSGGRGGLHCTGRELHPVFVLTPERNQGLHVIHVVLKTYSKIPEKNAEELSNRQCSAAAK